MLLNSPLNRILFNNIFFRCINVVAIPQHTLLLLPVFIQAFFTLSLDVENKIAAAREMNGGKKKRLTVKEALY